MSLQADLESWQILAGVPGIGPVLFRQLVDRFGSAGRVLSASLAELCSLPNIDEKRAEAIQAAADASLPPGWSSLLEERGIGILTYREAAYPQRLLNIYDFPPLLYVKGRLTKADELAVAVVGSRRASSYGRRVAEKLAVGLAHYGVTVVSGLARGIDSMAHRGALSGGGRTIAVLGSGIDIIYPPEHGELAEQIAQHGAIVSEFPAGVGPEPGHFPRRNRIISGLSLAVIVVEASAHSGALLTARFALDQNRDVLAVPGNIDLPGREGPHQLIQEGAKLVHGVQDILEELPLTENVTPVMPTTEPAEDLSPEEQRLFALLTDQPALVNDLIAQSGLPPSETLTLLSSLELKGLVQQLAGKRFARQ